MNQENTPAALASPANGEMKQPLTMDERRQKGLLYRCDDPEILAVQKHNLLLMDQFNALGTHDGAKKVALLKEMMAEFGENSWIEGRFYANWAGKFCHIGKNVYINFNFGMVDDGDIFIDDDVMIGPNVTLISGTHPNDPDARHALWQYTAPIHIERNAWIGAGATILPGVTIGENAIIGAHSLVNKDIPANAIAVGNPCKVLRFLSEEDKQYYGNHQPMVFD